MCGSISNDFEWCWAQFQNAEYFKGETSKNQCHVRQLMLEMYYCFNMAAANALNDSVLLLKFTGKYRYIS